MNEQHRNHRDNPYRYPRLNLPDADKLRKRQNKRVTGGASGNAHDRRVVRRERQRQQASNVIDSR